MKSTIDVLGNELEESTRGEGGGTLMVEVTCGDFAFLTLGFRFPESPGCLAFCSPLYLAEKTLIIESLPLNIRPLAT